MVSRDVATIGIGFSYINNRCCYVQMYNGLDYKDAFYGYEPHLKLTKIPEIDKDITFAGNYDDPSDTNNGPDERK